MSWLQVARHKRLGPTSIPICSCCYSPQAFVRPPSALPLPVHPRKVRHIPLAALEQNYTGYRYTRKGRSRPVVARLQNFSHLPKSVRSLGYCRLAFLTLSSSHFDPFQTISATCHVVASGLSAVRGRPPRPYFTINM